MLRILDGVYWGIKEKKAASKEEGQGVERHGQEEKREHRSDLMIDGWCIDVKLATLIFFFFFFSFLFLFLMVDSSEYSYNWCQFYIFFWVIQIPERDDYISSQSQPRLTSTSTSTSNFNLKFLCLDWQAILHHLIRLIHIGKRKEEKKRKSISIWLVLIQALHQIASAVTVHRRQQSADYQQG